MRPRSGCRSSGVPATLVRHHWFMATCGPAHYKMHADVPLRVAAAVAAARDAGFTKSCLPQQGRLLQVLAAGVGVGRIGETGTGFGVGLAWMVSAAHPQARLFSIDHDHHRARRAQQVFADEPRVQIRCGDWHDLSREAPFDMLVLDGGGQGKSDEPPLDPAGWLRPGGVVVLDDFTPMTTWPPHHDGRVDTARMFWLEHPRLRTTEVRVTPTAATIVAMYIG